MRYSCAPPSTVSPPALTAICVVALATRENACQAPSLFARCPIRGMERVNDIFDLRSPTPAAQKKKKKKSVCRPLSVAFMSTNRQQHVAAADVVCRVPGFVHAPRSCRYAIDTLCLFDADYFRCFSTIFRHQSAAAALSSAHPLAFRPPTFSLMPVPYRPPPAPPRFRPFRCRLFSIY